MRILFIGDIVGKPGRELVRRGLGRLVEHYRVDFVIANAENSAGGFGVTREICETLFRYGIEVLTSGNHIWDKKESVDYIAAEPRLLRPANFPTAAPGRGSFVGRSRSGIPVAVVNGMGRVFMVPIDNPFSVLVSEIDSVRRHAKIVLVDFHAEATSEKLGMGWHLDGRATAVVGTHTHVQTADEQILPGGTAYITDVGMTGPHDSIIGVVKEAALARFLTGMPARYETATGNPRLNAVVIEADPDTGKARSIERISVSAAQLESLSSPVGSVAP